MAGVGGRAAAHLSRHLARLKLLKGSKLTQGHAAALLHTTPSLDVGIFGWDEDDETGSFMEDLVRGLNEMTSHYNPNMEESTHHLAPRQHQKTLLGKEKETRRDKCDPGLPGISVAPLVDSLHITYSVIRNDEQAFVVSEKREPEPVQSPSELLRRDTKYEVDQHPIPTSTTSHKEEMVQLQKDQLKCIGKELPSPEDLPSAQEQLHTHDEHHFAGAPPHMIPLKATSYIDPCQTDLTSELTSVPLQMQKDSIKTYDSDIVEKSLDTDSSSDVTIEEELYTQAVDTTEGGGDSPGTTDISSVPQVPNDSKDVKVGTLIALMVGEGEDWKTVEMPSSEEGAASPSPVGTAATEIATKGPVGGDDGHGNYGPSVRLLLKQYGLKADDVPPGGPHGILVKGDVLRFVKERNLQPKPLESVPPPEALKPAAAPAATSKPLPPPPPPTPGVAGQSGYVDIEVTSMRGTIAKRLTQSKTTIAHSYASMECRMDNLLGLRIQFKAEGTNVSVNDLIIKSVAVALARCPEMNCVWHGDQLKVGGPVDISVAVATPGGLITPIVRGADSRGLEDIAATVRDLATRAKENKLKLDEFQGGTFTISNLGMFGIREFSAIINPPQCGILAVGGSHLIPDESGNPVPYMTSQLSFDRNAVDDFQAAEFLDTLKTIMENPKTILLGSYASQPHPLAALL